MNNLVLLCLLALSGISLVGCDKNASEETFVKTANDSSLTVETRDGKKLSSHDIQSKPVRTHEYLIVATDKIWVAKANGELLYTVGRLMGYDPRSFLTDGVSLVFTEGARNYGVYKPEESRQIAQWLTNERMVITLELATGRYISARPELAAGTPISLSNGVLTSVKVADIVANLSDSAKESKFLISIVHIGGEEDELRFQCTLMSESKECQHLRDAIFGISPVRDITFRFESPRNGLLMVNGVAIVCDGEQP